MNFSDFIGHDDAKLSLILNAIDPNCGGVIFVGERGTGKSTLARLLKNILPDDTPFVEMPLNVTEDALLGGIDIDATIRTGKRVIQKGLLSRANNGFFYIDDINLLPPHILSIILEVQNRGKVVIEREGFSIKESARFIILATMNPQEGLISPHMLDNFGMCAFFESLKDPAKRVSILKTQLGLAQSESDKGLLNKIGTARMNLEKIKVIKEIKEYIVKLCMDSNISGHRGEIFLFYAARAYAAYMGESSLKKEHVDTVLPLVFIHRQRVLEEKKQEQKEIDHQSREEKQEGNRDHEQGMEQQNKDNESEDESKFNTNMEQRESLPDEEIFDVGESFKTKRLLFKKDQKIRVATGRRTKTKVKGRSGRYVKSLMNSRIKDIAIDATIRAAAPFQRARMIQGNRGDSTIIIKDEDIRYKQREKRMGHLVIFVVDGSGSMGVQKRMVETKGAIKSLLMDCYQKRDRVSLIVFRKDKAEAILPPTSSVQLASKKLKEIPTGGKTPLGDGLLETYRLIKNVSIKEPETRFIVILISDGKANQNSTKLSVEEEIERISLSLTELPYVDFIVIDTEEKGKFLTTDYAKKIASYLKADYYTIKDLKVEDLTEIVKVAKKE
ncbi:magnesium-chelatase subunit ChlD [Dissulfurispira thermophila]|uniref:Magnesium-chelatase subunit ChlD n=1 Tax=Dissulfurispira thermophila TaxID=2715679 RepID=A0A7G1H163_9BACT|nr:AAA family ATPase [Dissulfurispira thermophila]BCB95952.1 magnesium-chelatase subunit ChlD [Dissulfurispira thermophila]